MLQWSGELLWFGCRISVENGWFALGFSFPDCFLGSEPYRVPKQSFSRETFCMLHQCCGKVPGCGSGAMLGCNNSTAPDEAVPAATRPQTWELWPSSPLDMERRIWIFKFPSTILKKPSGSAIKKAVSWWAVWGSWSHMQQCEGSSHMRAKHSH